MSALDVAIVLVALAMALAVIRIVIGPSPADRAVAADLLGFGVVAQIALIGTKVGSIGTYDLVLVATLVAFLAAVSIARAMIRGRR